MSSDLVRSILYYSVVIIMYFTFLRRRRVSSSSREMTSDPKKVRPTSKRGNDNNIYERRHGERKTLNIIVIPP